MRVTPQLSHTARLTLLFAMGSSVVLLALGWLISVSVGRHFADLDREALQAKLVLAHQAMARVTATSQLATLPTLLGDATTGHHDLLMQITGSDGQVVLSSSNGAFSGDWRAGGTATDGGRLLQWSSGAHHYRGFVATMPSGIVGAEPLEVAVAVDMAHHDQFMEGLTRTLWLFVAAAAVATGLLGWLAASRGLAPLKAMRARAELVSAHTLGQRLPTDAVPAELAALATTLNEMLARLEEAFRRLSDFSSDIAHELRTPVSNLMTQTQVSLSRPRDASAYREILESNAEEFERLARMVSDMLFLARADNALVASQPLLRREHVDLAGEVRDLFDFYEALAEEHGVRLALAGDACAMGDRLMLRRALSNLLSNALRYTLPRGCIQVRLAQADGGAEVVVENPGVGIAPEHLPHVFERFYRADASRHSAAGDGSGLGLAITRAIVLAHQGRIGVRSQDGVTAFTMVLPGV